MGVIHKEDSLAALRQQEQDTTEKEAKANEQTADTDALLADFAYRLTLLELGLEVN